MYIYIYVYSFVALYSWSRYIHTRHVAIPFFLELVVLLLLVLSLIGLCNIFMCIDSMLVC